MRFYEAIFYYIKYFGLLSAIRLVIYPRFMDRIKPGNKQRYINNLLKYQRAMCADIVAKYREQALTTNELQKNYIIWTCWWQGKENMPSVIRLCHESLLRNVNGHKVILITKENYKDYIELPQYIYDKVERGLISFSHFSDMIRLSLLCKYGGRWIDSALFVFHPLDFDGDFHLQRNGVLDNTMCQGRWWFGDIGGCSSHKVFHYMLDCLLEYWKKYDAVIDYLMFDGFLRIAYEEIPDIHKCIDELPVYSPSFFVTRYNAMKQVDWDKFNNMVKENVYQSLTWRIDYPEHTTNGELTYYGAMVEYAKNQSN